jgi:hypothetical protein
MTYQKSLNVCGLAIISIILIAGISASTWAADKHTQVGYGVDTNATVDIVVVTKADKPVSNAIVQLKSPGAFETTYRTDEEGYFTAMIPCQTTDEEPITHEVIVTHDNYKTATGSFTTGEGDCTETPKITFTLESK